MDVLNTIMQWVVAPLAGFVWLLHLKTQQNTTDIAVIKAQTSASKEASDREFKEVKESFKAVMEKLDNIEQHLRK
jgi:soluble cytochrome b562